MVVVSSHHIFLLQQMANLGPETSTEPRPRSRDGEDTMTNGLCQLPKHLVVQEQATVKSKILRLHSAFIWWDTKNWRRKITRIYIAAIIILNCCKLGKSFMPRLNRTSRGPFRNRFPTHRSHHFPHTSKYRLSGTGSGLRRKQVRLGLRIGRCNSPALLNALSLYMLCTCQCYAQVASIHQEYTQAYCIVKLHVFLQRIVTPPVGA